MTDVASEGEANNETRSSVKTKSRSQLDNLSRPGTARTVLSSRTQNQPLRHTLGKRSSVAASSVTSGRPGSSLSRSHVPTLTSHAFFHPMSSQKLQAQRSGTRPTMLLRQQSRGDIELSRDGRSVTRQSVTSDFTNPQMMSRLAQSQSAYNSEVRPPGSRGTEITDFDAGPDRVTANTSPSYGHYPTDSMSESVRPLQNKSTDGRVNGLTIRVDKNYNVRDNLPTPVRTPRSFRSSFMLPTRNGSPQTGPNRDMQGGEKLESIASSPQLSPADLAAAAAQDSAAEKMAVAVGRNFEFFQGNTVFFLGGRFQNTRSTPINIATGSLVVVPSILWFAFSAPWLWENISPAVPITFAYLFYICISSFIHASVSDPGILPRNLHQFPPPEDNEDPLRLGPPTTDWTLIRSAESATAAMEVPTKYCKTCNIWRPPRTHHCRLCDNCIETADHHCVWLNNCVGRRNYRYFFAFVTSTTILSLYLLASSLGQITSYASRENISIGQAIDHFRVPFALVIYGFLGFLYPAALMFYHVFLMARGETTREFLNSHKFLKKDRYRAFAQGNWFKNWVVVLCRPRPPTYYRFKDMAAPGDQRLAQRKTSETRQTETKEGVEMQDVGQATVGFQGPTSRAAHIA